MIQMCSRLLKQYLPKNLEVYIVHSVYLLNKYLSLCVYMDLENQCDISSPDIV